MRLLSVTRALHCTLLCASVVRRRARIAVCLTLSKLLRSHQDSRRPGGQLRGKRGPREDRRPQAARLEQGPVQHQGVRSESYQLSSPATLHQPAPPQRFPLLRGWWQGVRTKTAPWPQVSVRLVPAWYEGRRTGPTLQHMICTGSASCFTACTGVDGAASSPSLILLLAHISPIYMPLHPHGACTHTMWHTPSTLLRGGHPRRCRGPSKVRLFGAAAARRSSLPAASPHRPPRRGAAGRPSACRLRPARACARPPTAWAAASRAARCPASAAASRSRGPARACCSSAAPTWPRAAWTRPACSARTRPPSWCTTWPARSMRVRASLVLSPEP
jgi:hypothetical protein